MFKTLKKHRFLFVLGAGSVFRIRIKIKKFTKNGSNTNRIRNTTQYPSVAEPEPVEPNLF